MFGWGSFLGVVATTLIGVATFFFWIRGNNWTRNRLRMVSKFRNFWLCVFSGVVATTLIKEAGLADCWCGRHGVHVDGYDDIRLSSSLGEKLKRKLLYSLSLELRAGRVSLRVLSCTPRAPSHDSPRMRGSDKVRQVLFDVAAHFHSARGCRFVAAG